MKSGLALRICGGALALALAAHAQPTAPPPPKIAVVDPATVRGLPLARDYLPPSDMAFKASDFFSENVRLTAQWVWPSEARSRPLPTVVMAPGWGATAATLRQDAVTLARAGYRVMVFDYRGWGESDGRMARPAAGGTATGEAQALRGYIDPWEQAEDWFNAISYAVTEPGVDAGHIGVLGSDLAGGHVIYAAAHDPRVKALVSLVSRVDTRPYRPYEPDPAKVTADAYAQASRLAAGQAAYPADRARVPNGQGGELIGAPVGAKLVRWAPVEEAGYINAPALFVLAQNEELFSNTNNGQLACERVMGPRKLVMLPKITHYALYGAERERAINAAIDWFDRYLKPRGAPTRVAIDPKQPARGECNPPPEPPKGDEDPNGSGQGRKTQDASGRFN